MKLSQPWITKVTTSPEEDAPNAIGPLCAILPDGVLAQRLREHCRREGCCPVCRGNDRDMPCAFPGEHRPGCWRDERLKT